MQTNGRGSDPGDAGGSDRPPDEGFERRREPAGTTRAGVEIEPESQEEVIESREDAADDLVPGELDGDTTGETDGGDADGTGGDPDFARGPATLSSVLAEAAAQGYDTHLTPQTDGTVRCGGCGQDVDPASIEVDAVDRLEGASDVADMALVARVRCPECGSRSVLTLGYGPNASEADAAVSDRLELPHA